MPRSEAHEAHEEKARHSEAQSEAQYKKCSVISDADNFLTSKFSEQMIVDFFFSEVSTEPA